MDSARVAFAGNASGVGRASGVDLRADRRFVVVRGLSRSVVEALVVASKKGLLSEPRPRRAFVAPP